jgi:general secretion pathway protein I
MKRARGFSLIEVLVAMTLLTMAFAVLFSLSSRSLDGMRRAEDTERRLEFARNKLDQMKLITDLEPGDRATGQWEDGTRWTIEVTPFLDASQEAGAVPPRADAMLQIRLALEWAGRSGQQSWFVDTFRLVRPRAEHQSLESQLNALAK